VNGLASIPSPSFNSISLGPLDLRLYGLMIAFGVIAAVWLFGRRLEARGYGTRDDAGAIGMWGVVGGIIGSRLYHVVTDWHRFRDNLADIPKIWEGGLGIPGGIFVGVLFGAYVGRQRGIPVPVQLSLVAPSLPLAQAIGRWGNWFNQELFGRPTDLPWALEVDAEHIPAGYTPGTTFHPAFLYESLWNLGLAGALLLIDRRVKLGTGKLFALYMAGYGAGRLWIERLRIDPATQVGGLRWNEWMAMGLIVIGLAWFLLAPRREWPAPAMVGGPYAPDEPIELDDDAGDVSELAALDGVDPDALDAVAEPPDYPLVDDAAADDDGPSGAGS